MKFLSKALCMLVLGILLSPSLCAQNPSAILNLVSNDRGFLPPRMTEVERDAISVPEDGMIVFNTTESALNLYSNSEWQSLVTGNNSVNRYQRLSINALSFRPSDPEVDWEIDPLTLTGNGFRIVSPVNEYAYAHIPLPAETFIDAVQLNLYDNSPSEILEVSIIYVSNGFPVATEVVTYQTLNGSVTANVNVDHTMFLNASYYIRVHCENWSSDMGIRSVRIRYELPEG